MIKVTVLGSGGAFSDRFGNTQLFLEDEQKNGLLFDCGATHLENTRNCSFDRKRVTDIYISHLHDDHCAGLGTLALMHYFMPGFPKKPRLWIHHTLVKELWARLAPGLRTLADHQLPKGKKECALKDYFDVKTLRDNSKFVIGGLLFRPIQTVHVVHGAEFMASYGLEVIGMDDEKLIITGDTQFAPDQLKPRIKSADAVIHDIEVGPFKSGVHAHLDDLMMLPEDVRKKIHPIHYGDGVDFKVFETAGFGKPLVQGGQFVVKKATEGDS